jgi:hypothetical protein
VREQEKKKFPCRLGIHQSFCHMEWGKEREEKKNVQASLKHLTANGTVSWEKNSFNRFFFSSLCCRASLAYSRMVSHA